MKSRSLFVLSTLAVASGLACAQSLYLPSLTELQASTTVNQLRLTSLHRQSIIGQGVIVGVLDTGLNLANPEFKDNPRLLTGFNAVDGTTNVTDNMGHGTHVAGIIGASADGLGMTGVAPGARLLPVKVFGTSTARSADIDKGLTYALSKGARVINLSLGAGGPTGTTGLLKVANTNNTVVVAAAGNSGLANPGWPARYAKETWAKGTIIAVGAVDANKNIASFSNRAGDTANFYLVAPGVSIYSTVGTGYSTMSGTSMAAPAVTGAVALVMGYWPYLKANQVTSLMLSTTDDLGAPGVDPIYGRGMLNVARALTPQGTVSYQTSSGTTLVTSTSAPLATSSQPRVTSTKAFAGVRTQVFDSYGRNFTSDEGAALAATSQITVDSALGRTDRMLDAAETALPDGTRLMSLQAKASTVLASTNTPALATGLRGGSDPWNKTDGKALASMVSLKLASGQDMSAGDGGLSVMSLGLMGSELAARLSGAESALSNPLMGFAPDHRFATLSTPLTAGWSARVGVVRSKAYDKASADVNVAELMHQGKSHALNVSVGNMAEQGFLGGYSNKAMGLAQSTSTTGVTFSGAWSLSDQWTLAGSYSTARTSAPQATGLLVSGTVVKADGYGLGLVKADTWRQGDRLSFTVNAPLRATSGSLTYSVIDSVNPEDGSPHFTTRTVNLKPTARELLAETRYVTRLSPMSSLTAVAAYRQNPDHDATAPSQTVLGVRYNLSF